MHDQFPRIEITRVVETSEELYQACQRLVPQLTSNNPPPSREQLSSLLASSASFLYQAKHLDFGDEIIGLATLVLYHVPTGVRGYIEDVVVDQRARGKRIGKALTQSCLEQAEQAGAPQVMLTSNPGRHAANRLYERMGFELRKTNVYRYKFAKGKREKSSKC
jgi:ribosomal protein S18 acetylase RimI-like enzyme